MTGVSKVSLFTCRSQEQGSFQQERRPPKQKYDSMGRGKILRDRDMPRSQPSDRFGRTKWNLPEKVHESDNGTRQDPSTGSGRNT